MSTRSLSNPAVKFDDQFDKLSEKGRPETNPGREDKKEAGDSLLSKIKKRKGKKKIEDTHTRQTFLIKNEFADQLAKLYKKYGYGFKTEFINDAIEKGISALMDEEKMAK